MTPEQLRDEINVLEQFVRWMNEPSFASVHDLAKSRVRQRMPLDARPIVDVYLPGDSPPEIGHPSLCSPDADHRPS